MKANFFSIEPTVQLTKSFYESGSLVQGKLFFSPNEHTKIKSLLVSFTGRQEYKSRGMTKSSIKELFNESKSYSLESYTGLLCIDLNNSLPSSAASSTEYLEGIHYMSIAYFYKLDFQFVDVKNEYSIIKPFVVRSNQIKGKYPLTNSIETNISMFCGNKGECKIELTNKKEFYVWDEKICLELQVDNIGCSLPTTSINGSLIRKIITKPDSKSPKSEFSTMIIDEIKSPFECQENKSKKAIINLNLTNSNKLELKNYLNSASSSIYGKDSKKILDCMSSTFKRKFLIEFFVEVIVRWEGNACTDNELKISLPILVFSKPLIESTRTFQEPTTIVEYTNNINHLDVIPEETSPNDLNTFSEADPQSNFNQNLSKKIDEEQILEPQQIPENNDIQPEVLVALSDIENQPEIVEMPITYENYLVAGKNTLNNGLVTENQTHFVVTYKNTFDPIYIKSSTPNKGLVTENEKTIEITYKSLNNFSVTKNKGKLIETNDKFTITYKLSDQ